MYKTISEAIGLANSLKRELFQVDSLYIDIVICPPFTALSDVSEVINDSNIKLGAQDAYWATEGAFTGEVSCKMLKDAGCSYIIIGHSERRAYFHETNESVNMKVKAVLSGGLTPIMCVGETLAERENERTFEVLTDHLQNGLKDIPVEQLPGVVIAYEPVWAIGTGKTATPQQAEEAHRYIRGALAKMFDKAAADAVRIQYGGSVKPENITELMEQPDVDGALVGGASLTGDSFSEIVKRAGKVKK